MNLATHIVAPRMQSLRKLEKSLKRLDLSWKVIETTSRVVSPPESSGFIATLEHTRAAFSRLSSEIVEQIAQTHLMNCHHDLASRAQVAIDILVRNLFERTADVGFIATDGALVNFVLKPDREGENRMHARLTEYRNKYTVYDDILVLDASAQSLLSLKQRAFQTNDVPDWWEKVITNHGYLEVYGPSVLYRDAAEVLLYTHCIVSPAGEVCGAVVLKFDLQSELKSIFQALQHEAISILLLDDRARVVASSAPDGSKFAGVMDFPSTDAMGQRTLSYQGTDYLFAHCPTRGYQSYDGPGWTALALLRLDEAFDSQQVPAGPGALKSADSDIQIELDKPQLLDIIARARAIEQDLNRVIWNGKLQDSSSAGTGSALGPVFAEIGRTSFQTISAFDGAILELKNLLMAGRCAELASHAALAVDIMDRNLYERANDCRWWALSDEFAVLLRALEAGPSDQAVQRASEILAHLNSLYTVYQRVALFDRQGRILAVSRQAQTLAPGADIPSGLLQDTMALKGTQAYSVSAMLPHALADGESTYLYCAPIRSTGQERPLGGIALAFNCKAELKAMLQDSLPAGTAALGFFLDPQGKVLASTDSEICVGDTAEFFAEMEVSRTNAVAQPIVAWRGRSYLAGVAQSKGYREYKVSDGYRDDVRSVLLTPVDLSPQAHNGFSLPHKAADSGGSSQNYGVVQCGRMLFALPSTHVIEAVLTSQLTASVGDTDAVGLLKYTQSGQVTLLTTYDSCKLTGQAPIEDVSKAVAIIVQSAGRTVALLVDSLVDVIACRSLEPPPGGINPNSPWISGYIHDSQTHTEPIFAMDTAGLPVA